MQINIIRYFLGLGELSVYLGGKLGRYRNVLAQTTVTTYIWQSYAGPIFNSTSANKAYYSNLTRKFAFDTTGNVDPGHECIKLFAQAPRTATNDIATFNLASSNCNHPSKHFACIKNLGKFYLTTVKVQI